MKRLFALLVLSALACGGMLVGCEASAQVGDDDADDATYRRTTTIREPDGDRTVETEIRRED